MEGDYYMQSCGVRCRIAQGDDGAISSCGNVQLYDARFDMETLFGSFEVLTLSTSSSRVNRAAWIPRFDRLCPMTLQTMPYWSYFDSKVMHISKWIDAWWATNQHFQRIYEL